jgi:hypothetical protein
MASRHFISSPAKPSGADATRMPDVADAFQFASAFLDQQQQMLGLTSLAADTLRLMLRQTQRQMEYMSSLSRCRDWASAAALTTTFAQTMSQEVSRDWQQTAQLAERWMATTNQTAHRTANRLDRQGLEPDAMPIGSGPTPEPFAQAWPDPLGLMRFWSGEVFMQHQPPWRQ